MVQKKYIVKDTKFNWMSLRASIQKQAAAIMILAQSLYIMSAFMFKNQA